MNKYKPYFPDGSLGEHKERIYQHILGTPDGGLDRKSVLRAMDEYAECYHTNQCWQAFSRQPLYYVDGRGKRHTINPCWKRMVRRIKYFFIYRWLIFKYWIK